MIAWEWSSNRLQIKVSLGPQMNSKGKRLQIIFDRVQRSNQIGSHTWLHFLNDRNRPIVDSFTILRNFVKCGRHDISFFAFFIICARPAIKAIGFAIS